MYGNNRQLLPHECAGVFVVLCFFSVALIYVSEIFFVNPLSSVDAQDFFFDFQLRYNEVRCLFSGVDPLKVWNETAPSSDFSPWRWGNPFHFWHNYVHAYPTWSYTFFMPLAVLPKMFAAIIWFCIEILCGWGIYSFFFIKSRYGSGYLWMRLVPIIAALPIVPSVYSCLHYLNYGLPIAASVLLMAICLDRDRRWLAGVFLALSMVKPQIGLLFVVPLLIGGEFKTVFCGGAICMIATLPPALLCGESPIDMVLSVREYSIAYSRGCYTSGAFVGDSLFRTANINLLINAFVGVSSCAMLSWLFRMGRSWLFRLIPACVTCVIWTVARPHDLCILVLPICVLTKLVVAQSERPDVAAVIFFQYFLCVILRGIGLRLVLPVIMIFLVVAFLAFSITYLLKLGRAAKELLLITIPMVIVAISVESVDLSMLPVVYFASMAYIISVDKRINCLIGILVPSLFIMAGSFLPSQTAGWAILFALAALGCNLTKIQYVLNGD